MRSWRTRAGCSAVRATRLPVVLVVIALGACARAGPAQPAFDGSPAIHVVDAPMLPTTVDELPSMDVAAYEAMMGDLGGTPAVVNFWATWCPPCTREMPMMARAARDLRGAVQFVGVNVLDDRASAREMLHELRIPYPNVFDETGEIRTAVGGIGQPVTVFYRADGTVAARVEGELSQQDLETYLAEVRPDPT